MMITEAQLREIMPALKVEHAASYLPYINEALELHEINTPLRAAAFLAQIAYESDQLIYFAELWGPTAQQKKYEPETAVSKELGNTEKGDGYKYRGRGPLQITGRDNYKRYGLIIGVDIVKDPDLASEPEHAFSLSGAFWVDKGLNELADKADFVEITRKINGGTTGLEDREKYYASAKKALGVS